MELGWDIKSVLNVGLIGLATALLAAFFLNRGRRAGDGDISRRLTGRAASAKSAKSAHKRTRLVEHQQNTRIENVAKVLARPLEGSDYERNRLSMKLAQAGYRNERATAMFLATKMGLSIFGLIAGFVLYKSIGDPNASWDQIILWPMGGLGAGFFSPQLWLDSSARSRSEKIGNALPDMLDMLVIMVEAGLGLDAGIQRCADEMQKPFPDIAEELRQTSRETQLGLKRSEALKRMGERTGVKEMQALVAMLTQAERFGTSIATGLRVHSESLRIKRRQKAEEVAGKVATKLVFPLILFIFPTIFIVTVGPAAMKIAAMFGP